MEDYLKTVLLEISNQKEYLEKEELQSIYFGGGTPSILSGQAIEQILSKITANFKLGSNVEITLEANPDDLALSKLQELKAIGINRLSIGTQSFHEADLQFMRRAHNAKEAIQSIEHASKLGFTNLSIDLIYGVPTQSEAAWDENLQMIEKLGVNHLSSYALTVEEGTPLFHEIRKGKVSNIDDQLAAVNFKQLQAWASQQNWQHYEISNLCKAANFAIHNTAYWQGASYLGIGPAAHSFNGVSRQWNVANLKKYIEALESQSPSFTKEILSEKDQYHEYILTGIRTMWGVNKQDLANRFPDFYPNFEKQLMEINPSWIKNLDHQLVLSDEGMFYADGIASHLFID
ncbi:MAG: oxygen-independent coproporphyrinogen-3 oxidase [Chitinophagales bacterium]|jgi:oxygen-independent coproporphyrinogen-3 oxidase